MRKHTAEGAALFRPTGFEHVPIILWRNTSPLNINFDTAAKFQLGALALAVTGNHPTLSGEVTANITGNMHVDYAAQNEARRSTGARVASCSS